MTQFDDIQATIAALADDIQQLRVQMVMIVELLSALVTAEDQQEWHQRANVGAPRVMRLGDESAITRQAVDDRGHLVTITNKIGGVIDQAFQFTTGEWHSVGLNESGDLMIGKGRDAIHVR